jgi:hypothetical protein
MSKHASKSESRITTCRDAGHDWMTTAAANWRVCQREGCRASERPVDGQWVSNAKAYRFHDPVVEYRKRQHQPRQATLRAGHGVHNSHNKEV